VSQGFDTAATVLRKALGWGAIAAVVIAVVAGVAGLIAAGTPGLLSGLIGAAFALLFLGVTALSLLVAGRFRGLGTNAFFAAMLAGWLVKFVVFLIAMLALRDQPWVEPIVLFASIVATVLASLVIDAVVVSRARIPVGA
jgi:Na+/proline symporter